MSNELMIPFQEVEKMASAVAKSGLFGLKTPEQALALLLLAQAEGMHPMIAARDYDIIQGKPAKKAEAMLRSFLGNGGTVKWITLTDDCVKATFSHPIGGEVTVDWTIARATKAGLPTGNGGMYTKYPRQMLRSRCVSEGVRTVWPSATSGMYVPEEVTDFTEEPIKEIKKSKKEDKAVDVPVEEAQVVKQKVESLSAPTKEEPIKQTESSNKILTGIIENKKIKPVIINGKAVNKYGVMVGGKWSGTFDTKIYDQILAWEKMAPPILLEVEYVEDVSPTDGKTYLNLVSIKPVTMETKEQDI